MSTIKTRGIVLKTQDYKENDKLLWIFTEDMGKVSVIAKGARKSKNKNFSNTMPFCFGEYILYKGRALYTLNEGRIIDSFQDLLNDYDTLIYGSYFAELIDITMEEEINHNVFLGIVKAFYLMRNKAVDEELLARAFEIKLLKAVGYGISLEKCAFCGCDINMSNYISFQYYGGVCDKCDKQYGTKVSSATYNGLKFLNKIQLEKVGRLNLDKATKAEIKKILSTFMELNYRRKPKSLSLL
ncbi:MAG: DNA repair protein RecO [Clostridium sp.]|uniref:DNA repair protein RecO n=1 Tax=Clostridium sp. TaxID=1506 RepID=UPI003039AD98